jgi:uncharacterized membrane protein YkvA (DUF1232 family)
MSQIQKTDVRKPTRKEKGQMKDRMKNMLMFLPNMVKLLGKLLTDNRVPTVDKALFAGAVLYVFMPLDFIPDFLPFIGQVDDTYLVALTLLRLINRSDETIVRQHWRGGGDIISLANSIANIAPMLLPKRVSRVLSSEVELTASGKALENITKKQALFVEISERENEKVKISSPS